MALILVIEDNLEIRENITEMLALSGHEVIIAENGAIGISMALENLPHIILCDILMPEASGYEVFKNLNGNAATADIPFVFVTASAEKSEVQAGLDMGAHGYIRKPFEMEELLGTINSLLK